MTRLQWRSREDLSQTFFLLFIQSRGVFYWSVPVLCSASLVYCPRLTVLVRVKLVVGRDMRRVEVVTRS